MLKGTLDDFTLPDIFRLLSTSKKTGSLEVERSAGQGTVFFREGDVYFAESTLSKELLGQKLVKAGAITSGQLMKALDQQAASDGKRLGEVLLDDGLVNEDQLETAVRGQIEDAVFDLLRWELGEFSWNLGEEVNPEVVLSVSVENLIMEASRRLDELNVIQRKIPSEQSVLTMAPTPPEGAVEINITPDEWRVMVMVNGQRTVHEISESVGLDVFQTMRTLYGLVSAGLIEVPGHTPPDDDEDVDLSIFQKPEPVAEEPVEEPVAEVEAVVEDEPADLVDQVFEAEPEPVEQFDPGVAEELTSVSAEDFQTEGDAEVVPFEMGDASVEGFDAPAPGELTTETPAAEFESADSDTYGADPFASEILAPESEAVDVFGEMPAAPPSDDEAAPTYAAGDFASEDAFGSSSSTDIPVTPESSAQEPTVDKSAAVRELSNLFKQTEVDSSPTFLVPPTNTEAPAETAADPENKKRVEDDEEITRGLISRLIDGVKGL